MLGKLAYFYGERVPLLLNGVLMSDSASIMFVYTVF